MTRSRSRALRTHASSPSCKLTRHRGRPCSPNAASGWPRNSRGRARSAMPCSPPPSTPTTRPPSPPASTIAMPTSRLCASPATSTRRVERHPRETNPLPTDVRDCARSRTRVRTRPTHPSSQVDLGEAQVVEASTDRFLCLTRVGRAGAGHAGAAAGRAGAGRAGATARRDCLDSSVACFSCFW